MRIKLQIGENIWSTFSHTIFHNKYEYLFNYTRLANIPSPYQPEPSNFKNGLDLSFFLLKKKLDSRLVASWPETTQSDRWWSDSATSMVGVRVRVLIFFLKKTIQSISTIFIIKHPKFEAIAEKKPLVAPKLIKLELFI